MTTIGLSYSLVKISTKCAPALVRKQQPDLTNLSILTFNFRSPDYSAEAGGVHPVELRRIRELHGWVFDYITDFSYQGMGRDTELCKELDFNLSCGEHYLQGWGPLPGLEARDCSPCGRAILLATPSWGISPSRSTGSRGGDD